MQDRATDQNNENEREKDIDCEKHVVCQKKREVY